MISQKIKIHFSFPCGGSVQGDLGNLRWLVQGTIKKVKIEAKFFKMD